MTSPKQKFLAIEDDVAGVLRRSSVDGNKLLLPAEQLTPMFYRRVDRVINMLGGSWNRKFKAHIFDGSPSDALSLALRDGKVVNRKKTYQFFETPPELARRMTSLADIRVGDIVLEPSAGRGAIARQILIAQPRCSLHLIELDLEHLAALQTVGTPCIDIGTDFLAYAGLKFHRIVMNPPFNSLQDVDHVRHAYSLLKDGGRLVAIMSLSPFQNETRKAKEFRNWLDQFHEAKLIEDLPAGTFSESGTEIAAKLVIIQKHRSAPSGERGPR